MCWLSLLTARFELASYLILSLSNTQQFFFFISFGYDFYFTVKVTRSVNTDDGELSPQERKTIESIVNARYVEPLKWISC